MSVFVVFGFFLLNFQGVELDGGSHGEKVFVYETAEKTFAQNSKPAIKHQDAGTVGNMFLKAIKAVLYGIFLVFAWFLGVAAVIFGWVVNPENIYRVLWNPAIYESWKTVRDILNIAFILTLLFSAFCTVFQVSKYHLIGKGILLNVILVALLVNFSFPIARFVIDVSHIIFYFLFNSLVPAGGKGESIFAQIAEYSSIVKVINFKTATSDSTSVWFLLAIITLTFILMITFLVIALCFVVRLAVLGIVIILSPVGFVGLIFPAINKHANDWWDALFKYSFFAPIMMFVIVLSVKIMQNMSNSAIDATFLRDAGNNVGSSDSSSFVASAALFFIPVILLWTGFLAALKLGGAAGEIGTKAFNKSIAWSKKMAKGTAKGAGYAAWAGARKIPGFNELEGKTRAKLKHYKDTLTGKKGKGVDERKEAYDEEMAVREARQKARASGKDPKEAEAKARQKFKEKRNREAIKERAENWENKNMKDVVDEIERIENGISSKGLAPSQENFNELAGLREAAKRDSKEYEKEIKRRTKASTPYAVPEPSFDRREYVKKINQHKLLISTPLPSGTTQDQKDKFDRKVLNLKNEIEALENAKKLHDEWKKEKKEFYQDETAKTMKQHGTYTDQAIKGV